MGRRVFLVTKVHFINFPLLFLLSFMGKVKTLKMWLPGFYPFKKKIELIQFDDYWNWEECMVMRADAVKVWEDILLNFPESKWNIHIKDSEINMVKKAKQDIQREFENMFFLMKIADHYKKSQSVYIIDSLYFSFIKSIIIKKEISLYSRFYCLSLINIMFDILLLNLCIYFIALKLIAQLIYGLVNRKDKKHNLQSIKYIWAGISPRELSVNKERNSFSWIIDDNFVHKEDVLFLLPRPDFQMKDFSEDEAKKAGLLTISYANLACFSTSRILLLSLLRILRTSIIFPKFNLIKLAKTGYALQIMKWLPVMECIQPKAYINSFSNLGCEDPAIIYFQKIGIKTIMWAYGTNSYLFTTANERCDFRSIIYCNILSSTFIAWNNHFKEFIDSHTQDNLETVFIGPLMCGDESVHGTSRDVIYKTIGVSSARHNKNLKYVAVFDAPPVSRVFKGFESVYPDSNSEEYNCAFIKDVFRLLTDFENICLLYKPKRSLTSGKFSYNNELGEMLERMSKSPRVKILDYNINPWVPIASADISINLPFESPFIAYLHYGKPALFHDPMDIVFHHRYQGVTDLITHNYEELKSKVNYWLFENERVHLDIISESKYKDFVGLDPLTRSSEKFRKYLACL
ncbi:MAG: hypothetical protein A2W05_03280 [Candidatus Schekmanbacteria bacterium RBG_16_38_10]|uniref:Uncharacterized protein n=1 Tax=Candidatus Schekmanbacteria bacterium RBG_16_38_10 TaxID=1817879 RepID=A0A1F7S164_9BACT|nr:MAG: hypothetical protein A2W05_03280 [Candidatus Schekmanbacteria bacterium RBG_16_38_10]